MSQPPHQPGHDDPPTSDRLYTTAELEEFARQQLEHERAAAPGDEQAPEIAPETTPETAAEDAAPNASPTDRLDDPLTDPLTAPIDAAPPSSSDEDPTRTAGSTPTGPPPSAPPAGWQQPAPALAEPTTPPPSTPPPSWRPDPAPAGPAGPAGVDGTGGAMGRVGQMWHAEHTAQEAWPQDGPAAAQPPAYVPQPPEYQPEAADGAAVVPAHADAPRRFMTATDFLDRRDGEQVLGPATWGWQGRVRRWSGGLISPTMSAAEQAHERDRHSIQKDFDGPRTIAFINPKGGAAKTTSVLAAGFTFGTVRGGGVVAWDNNETRGTLGIRGARSTHRNTTRELLEDLERFKDVYQSRIGDLGAFVRSQGDAHFDVLASDERPDVTGTIRAEDFGEVHGLLERFYRIILVDTGNNMRAENWLAAADAADLLVVTTTVREDTGYSGLWMLDALQDAGYQSLKHKTITVMSDPSDKVDPKLAADLQQVYEQRTRGVYRVPYDPAMIAGSVVPYNQLSDGTTRSWLRACAGMADAL